MGLRYTGKGSSDYDPAEERREARRAKHHRQMAESDARIAERDGEGE